MESREFIRSARRVINAINDQRLLENIGSGDSSKRQQIQREINQLFGGLQNPTLMAANELYQVATSSGYRVDQELQHWLARGEAMWQ